MITVTAFKRVPLRARFSTVTGAAFRKITERTAIATDANGVGKTHAKIRFARSTTVTLLT